MHVALPKWPIDQFKPVQKSRQQELRAYFPNIYTVTSETEFIILQQPTNIWELGYLRLTLCKTTS